MMNINRNQGRLFLILLLLCVNTLSAKQSFNKMEKIKWEKSLKLPPCADMSENIGLASMFAGFIEDELVMVGGTNFPGKAPWNGGVKKWWNTLYAINVDSTTSNWFINEHFLPESLAYGVSIQLQHSILCIGGNNSEQCSNKVFSIYKQNGGFKINTNWPSLPCPLSNATGALMDGYVYIAGGQEHVKKPRATNHFFRLQLSNVNKGWEELPTWPGKARGYAISVAQSNGTEDCFYLFSGRNYYDKIIEPLKDAFVYNPRLGKWKRLSGDFPVMAASAVSYGANHILFLGGVPKILPTTPQHPGFDNTVRVYHTITHKMFKKEIAPFKIPVTTCLVKKDLSFYLVSGEVRPGVRTPYIVKGEIISLKRNFGYLNYSVIFLYFITLVWIGYYFSKKQKNTNDYFKGGGKIPWWVVGLSIFATTLSAITFMAIPAKAYASDWSYLMMNAGIVLVIPFIIYLFIPYYRKINITTAYEYLEYRFNAVIRVICSITFILFQIGRMGIVLYLPAIALNVVTGLDIFLCISLMGLLSLAYTLLGGIEAVIWTDALQAVVLLGGAILVICIIAIDMPGGFTQICTEAAMDNKFSLGSFVIDWKQSTFWTVIVATFFTNLITYSSDQTVVQRYLTTGSIRKARKSVYTNVALAVPATFIFFFVGTALYIYYKHLPQDLSLNITDGDAILPWFVYSKLPDGVSGLLISGIFAAAMSTLSSSINSAATAYVTDIHTKINHTAATNLKIARKATFILGLLGLLFAYMMATWEIKSMWDEFNKILGLIMGSMGGLFLLGILTKRANSAGAVCGLIGSIVVQIVMIQTEAVHLLLYSATGFISCFVIGYIASFFFRSNK